MLCGVGWVKIKDPPQTMPLRPNEARLQYGMAAEPLVDGEVVVLHVGHLDVTVESKDVAFIRTGRFIAEQRRPRGYEPSKRPRWLDRCRANGGVRRARVEERE